MILSGNGDGATSTAAGSSAARERKSPKRSTDIHPDADLARENVNMVP